MRLKTTMTLISNSAYPGYITAHFVQGEDLTISLDFNQDNGDPFDFTGITVEAIILDRSTKETGHSFSISIVGNTVTFFLPKTITTELKEKSYLSYLKLTDTNQIVYFPREVRFILISQSYGGLP